MRARPQSACCLPPPGLAFYVGALLIAGDRDDVMDAYNAARDVCPPLPTFACPASLSPECAALCSRVLDPCIKGDNCQTGGSVLAVFFAVIIGAMSLGQAQPSLSALAKGRAAAYKVFEVIRRRPAIDPDSDEGRRLPRVEVGWCAGAAAGALPTRRPSRGRA